MIGFVVEGPSDKKVIYEVCRTLSIETKKKFVRPMDGNRLKRAKKHSVEMLSSGCKKVVILKDLHQYESSEINQKFNETRFPEGAKLCIVVKAIESWILADERAIGDYIGSNVKEIHNPESIPEPDKYLNKIFKKGKEREYKKGGQDSAEIAKRLDLEAVERKCPSFREFRQVVQNSQEIVKE